MIEKRHNDLMNRRLNLLTIWSTIFLPLSFYTGLWGMNFDDVPLISDDHGFWIFAGFGDLKFCKKTKHFDCEVEVGYRYGPAMC